MAHSSSSDGEVPRGNSAGLVPGRKRRREPSPESGPTVGERRPRQDLFPVPPARRLPYFDPPGSGPESDSDSGEDTGTSESTDTTAIGSDFEGIARAVGSSTEEELPDYEDSD